MENSSYVALSRQMVLSRQMDVIANNIANMNTTAYKGEGMMFVEYLDRSDKDNELSFVQDISVVRNLAEGPMMKTDNPLDLAISDQGYFAVDTEEGERYTRNGSFQLDQDGQIVTSLGYPLLSNGGSPIVVPPDATHITISRDGTVSSSEGEAGRIGIVRFENEQALRKLANNLYEAGGEDPQPSDESEVMQGIIEGSNVQGVTEITKLISTSRSYQAAAKLIDEEHERQRRAIQALAGQQ